MTKLERTATSNHRRQPLGGGTRAIFGGSNPAAVLYGQEDFIEKNPNTHRRWSTPSTRRSVAGEKNAGADRRHRAEDYIPRRQPL